MTIIEFAVTFNEKRLLKRVYRSTKNLFSQKYRYGLLEAIDSLARVGYQDKIQSFSLGKFTFVFATKIIKNPAFEDETGKLMLYAIVSKGMSELVVYRIIQRLLAQFMDRYSKSHLFYPKNKYLENMDAFLPRIDHEFHDLLFNSEEKVKAIFS